MVYMDGDERGKNVLPTQGQIDRQRNEQEKLATERTIDKLREACKAVDDLWSADCGAITMNYDEEVNQYNSPVGQAWKKIREALASEYPAESEK